MDKKSGSWFTRFKHKNENLALIFVGMFIISAIVFVVAIANNHPWMPFKFNPEEFGTVSDWVMVFVTLVTAVFLYQTLRSQMTVQRDQNRIFKMEELKYIREIRPKITFTFAYRKKWQETSNSHEDKKLLAVDLTVTINSDKEGRIAYKVFTESKVFNNSPLKNIPRVGNSTYYTQISFKLNVKEYSNNVPVIENLLFNVNYFDCDGNEYSMIHETKFLYSGGAEYILLSHTVREDKIIQQLY